MNWPRCIPPAMISFTPFPPRVAVWKLAFMSAGFLSSIQAQEVSPVIEDRVESGDGVVPLESQVDASLEEERRGGLEIAAVLSTAYDSNIFLSKTDAESDTVTRVGPAIAYTQGDSKEGEGGFIRFAYKPTAVFYSENSSENRVDHQAAITAGWRGKVTAITYSGAIQKLADAIPDTGQQSDRLEYANEIRAAWIPREKVTVEAAVGNKDADYVNPALFDSSNVYGEAALRYAYSPKTELSVAYQPSYLKVDGASRQLAHQVTAGIDWKPREKIQVRLEAGGERRETENGTDTNPVLEGRIDWTPRKGTTLFLAGYQREEASAYSAGQNYSVKGFTAGVAQRLGDKWTLRVEGGQEQASYTQVAGTGTAGRKDKIWYIRPSLGYTIKKDLDLSIFYRASDNSSTSRDFGYADRMAGVELNYRF